MSSRLIPFRRQFLARSALLPATRSRLALQTRYQSSGSGSSTSNDQEKTDAQLDRTKMDTQSDEYAVSGTDSESATDHAFDPNSSNDPDEARKEASDGDGHNPLDASPANPELSSGTSEVSGGADKKMSEGGGGRQGGGDTSGDKIGGSSS